MFNPLKLFVLCLALLLLTACGEAAASASEHLVVEMSEFMYTPKDLVVPAGQEITLDLSNQGGIEHNFVILKAGEPLSGNPDAATLAERTYFTATLGPGKAETFTFTAPAAGEYQVICSIPGHLSAGMSARLIVK